MVGLLPTPEESRESDVQIKVKRPDHLLTKYRVFIQDMGPGNIYLPKGSSLLLQKGVCIIASKSWRWGGWGGHV